MNSIEDDHSPQEIDAVWEELVVAALDDPIAEIHSSNRVSEVAAFVLSKRWPKRYPFTRKPESPQEVEMRILELKNAWRGAHGLAPLPIPATSVQGSSTAE